MAVATELTSFNGHKFKFQIPYLASRRERKQN